METIQAFELFCQIGAVLVAATVAIMFVIEGFGK